MHQVSNPTTKKIISRNSYAFAGHDESTTNNKFQTFSVHTYDNGDRYEGEWKNGKKHGKGTMDYANGNKYTGIWVNDNRAGQGVFTWTNGNRYEMRCSQITCHRDY